jgi:hypothetical protein
MPCLRISYTKAEQVMPDADFVNANTMLCIFEP